MTTFDYDQAEWGSSLVYPDNPVRVPRYLVIHYGGTTNDIVGVEAEMYRLRAWQNYHINGKGMRDIAYCYAVGDSGMVYRMRGNNDNGGNKSSDRTPEGDSYNEASIAVVWIGGTGAGEPTPEAYESMAQIVYENPGLVVKSHNLTKVENGSGTGCPGEYWKQWILREGWNDWPINGVELGMPYEQFVNMVQAMFAPQAQDPEWPLRGNPAYFTNYSDDPVLPGIYDDPDNIDWDNFWDAFTDLITS